MNETVPPIAPNHVSESEITSSRPMRHQDEGVVRIAAFGDTHYTKASQGLLQDLLARVARRADVLLLCGDLTDHGLPEEAQALAHDLAAVKIPMLAVLGNHDFEAGRDQAVVEILSNAGVITLDGEAVVVHGVGFAGAKGFAGGFGRRMLEPWGEPAIKNFVQAAIEETLKLEGALARLRTSQRVAVLHYAPIQGTADGEPVELMPFLGSTRLEEPLNRYQATVVFHGHVHRGSPEGRTSTGIPVYNVALPLLRRSQPDGLPVRFVELPSLDNNDVAD